MRSKTLRNPLLQLWLVFMASWLGCVFASGGASVFASVPSSQPTTQPATQPATQPVTRPATQPVGEYIEYRAQPQLARITISDCAVRGANAVRRMTDRAAELSKEGIFPCTDDEHGQIYRRTERMAGRRVDTLVVIEPPPVGVNEGEEAYGTQRLIVRVDGHKKVDCTIGTTMDGELWIGQVVIHPEDGTLEIHAITGDGEELTLPDEWASLDEPTVITDDSFFEDLPQGGGAKPQKV